MRDVIDTTGLGAGFAAPVLDAQRAFRGLLEAMSYPGRIVGLDSGAAAPVPLAAATAAICLALADFDTPLWLDAAASASRAPDWLRFHCGVPLVEDADAARFAVVTDPAGMPPLRSFHPGVDEYPDRSATVVVQVDGLAAGSGLRLTGPGIREEARLAVAGLPPRFLAEWEENRRLYPLGVDVLLVSGDRVVGLPRTIRLEG